MHFEQKESDPIWAVCDIRKKTEPRETERVEDTLVRNLNVKFYMAAISHFFLN